MLNRLKMVFRALPPLGRVLLSIDIFLEVMGAIFIVKTVVGIF